jgi:hypothetical protein
MATQPTNPPSVTPWPDAPSRAEPATFSAKSDAFLGHFPIGQADQNNLVTWLNSTAGQSYQNALEAAASATASAASADLAQDALDNAISATNYKGAWSSLTGALNIPASVSHDGGVWLLTTNLANVAASEPAIGNANWLLIYSRATDLQVETGVAYTNPDSKQLKDFVQRDWSELTTAKTYNDSCFYRGKEYDINIPVDDVTIAPPTTAGCTYTNFNGSTQYIPIPTINLVVGDVVKFKFLAPTSVLSFSQYLTEVGMWLQLANTGFWSLNTTNYTTRVDGTIVNAATKYPTDGLVHSVECTINTGLTLDALAAKANGANKYKGRIYDLEVIRGGERIHYYPLRTDAVDYLAGNLIKDEEFTYSGNWTLSHSSISLSNNSVVFTNTPSGEVIETPSSIRLTTGTYRYMYEYDVSAGSISGFTRDTFSWDTARTGNGKVDSIVIHDTIGAGKEGILTVGLTTATIKNFRVIKLNELSPSASFDSATGFALSSGVTITGGQAVFDGGAGAKSLLFNLPSLSVGKRYRIAYSITGYVAGSLQFQIFDGGTQDGQLRSANGAYSEVIEVVTAGTSLNIGLYTNTGFNGNVEYFSVTEVTDGAEVGSPLKTFERHWKLKSGEQLLPQNAGIVRFGVPATISASNTLEIEPLANAAKGDYIKVARTNGAEPVIKLSAADITAGRLIKYGAQTDTELTIDSDKAVILEHNGIDLEVKL